MDEGTGDLGSGVGSGVVPAWSQLGPSLLLIHCFDCLGQKLRTGEKGWEGRGY